jgi:hypothetical protein
MNHEEINNRADAILLEEDEFIVPVERLRELILDEKEDWPLTLEELLESLSADQRFRIIDIPESPTTDDLKSLGFYSGPRVLLLERLPEETEAIQALTEQMQASLTSLREVYRERPVELTDEEELEYIQIMKRVRDLEHKLAEWRDQRLGRE